MTLLKRIRLRYHLWAIARFGTKDEIEEALIAVDMALAGNKEWFKKKTKRLEEESKQVKS